MLRSLLTVFLLSAAALIAEPRTFTDQFGRTIVAEIVSVEKDQVRIRREDGQVFALAISKLSEADQKAVRDWAAAQPSATAEGKPPLDPAKLTLTMSRAKFDSITLSQSGGYSHKHEMWGYNIEINNQHPRAVEKLRIEYNLFSSQFSDSNSPACIPGSKDVEAIKTGGKEAVRTATAEVCRTRSSYSGNNGGELRGIWVRFYVDGKLFSEQSLPESLRTTEKWKKPPAAE